jgi:2-amino-4-hydroxy-6-hydroxymethyldihydropteridine diphosphokinase
MPAETVFLSLGTNLGDREKNLRGAIAALPGIGFRVQKVSSFYETEPVDYLDQPWFLNCVVQGETQVPAPDLLLALRGIEINMGSKKEIPKGPRLIDMDILLCGNVTIATEALQIPHPRMLLRKFVLAPLAEIAPDATHPSWNATAKEMLARVADPSDIRRITPTE